MAEKWIQVRHLAGDDWLRELAYGLVPLFVEAGYWPPVVEYKYCWWAGDPDAAVYDNDKQPYLGQCEWGKKKRIEVLEGTDPVHIAEVLAHELCHACLGRVDMKVPWHRDVYGPSIYSLGHGPVFAELASAIGLEPPWWATKPGQNFRERVAPILAGIGPLPRMSRWMRIVEDDEEFPYS